MKSRSAHARPARPARPARLAGLALCAASLCLVATGVLTSRAAAIETGTLAPEISGKDQKGKTVSLSALRGKVVVVDFMASWCAPCKQELPLLDKLYQRYKAHGLVVIGVSVDEKADKLQAFLKDVPVSFSVVHDAERKLADRYAPPRMPSTYIIDKQGTIRHMHGGFRAGDEKTLEKEVRALLR